MAAPTEVDAFCADGFQFRKLKKENEENNTFKIYIKTLPQIFILRFQFQILKLSRHFGISLTFFQFF